MANLLQFTLGMATGGFISAIDKAKGALAGFTGATLSLGAAAEGVWHAIEHGAALQQLSKRTGQSVGDLFELQRGFRAVGLSSDDVGSAIYQFNKALGGVNEAGESTTDIFSRLHLKIRDLKALAAPQQFEAITKSLARLDQSSATKAASLLFGRGEAANMLQLARSSQEFGEAIKKAVEQSKVFERNAKTWEQVSMAVGALRYKLESLWSGVAEGVVPMVQQIVDWLDKIDLSKFGKRIGDVFKTVTEAFREGAIGDFLALSLQVGFEKAAVYASGFVVGFAAQLANAIPNSIHLGVELAKLSLGGLAGSIKMLYYDLQLFFAKKIGNQGAIKEYSSKMDEVAAGLEYGRAEGVRNMVGIILKNYEEGFKAIAEGVKSVQGPETPAEKALKAMQQKFLAHFNAAEPSPEGKTVPGINLNLGKLTEQHLTEGNVFEKMGFGMAGGMNFTLDYSRRTADNTARIVEQNETIIQHLENRPIPAHAPL